MAPKSCQETEEEQVPLAPADEDLQPSAGTSTDRVDPSCPQDIKPPSTLTPVDGLIKPQGLAPETLDPRTLNLLWKQRELEIQALRCAIQNGQKAWHSHILQEVAGIPPERSIAPPTRNYNSQNKSLQNQVQRLTLELKTQKEQAQLQEKERLEEQLRQNVSRIQQLEAELQSFQKSCLLQLARSSWVGCRLRSQTGSVEVVTAEILKDLNDSSGSDESPTTGENFRLEDVDWNSIAHRYPNLFSNFSSDHKQNHHPTLPLDPLDTQDSDSSCKYVEKAGKSLEWSTLPLVDNSSSGGANSDSSSCQLAQPSKEKMTGHLPQRTGSDSSEQMQACTRNFSGQVEDLRKSHSDGPSKTVLVSYSALLPRPSPAGCSVKIVAVSHRKKFIRMLNQSRVETVDLGGFVLQQLVRDCPVCMYRFPPATLLAPGHHITVWGEGTCKTKPQPIVPLGQDAFHFQSSRGCVTLLVNTQGQVVSEHHDPPRVAEGLSILDNTDWSIDCFPLAEARPDADPDPDPDPEPDTWRRRPPSPRKGRVQEARARPGPSQRSLSRGGPRPPGTPRPTKTRGVSPPRSTGRPLHPGEVPAQPGSTKLETSELLPALPGERRGCRGARGRLIPQACRKSVDRSCPMVALSVQNTAESKYGFRFLCYPPISEEVCRRL
uniref:Lamin tail domain containing 2 n=1 Tax=Jaculus jaculus TaxID=51337 RepID=A0A8C5P3H7_JACJA